MKDIRVVFMGSPSFSVPILEALIEHTNVVGVITSLDKEVGRKKELKPSPVKEVALAHGIKVYTPERLRRDYEYLYEINPDVIITCAYGQIVPKEVLDIPKCGCINIHASLLPKYRGASPIISAIMAGEEKTGITLMYMDEGLDTGDIIAKEEEQITPLDNNETLSNKLSALGAKMIIDYLPLIFEGKAPRIKQNSDEATYVGLIKREDEHLDFNEKAIDIYNKVRAFAPNPYANILLDEMEYKIGLCEIVPADGCAKEIVSEDKKSFTIMAQDQGIRILEIKPSGKKMMSVADFKNGYHGSLVGKRVQ